MRVNTNKFGRYPCPCCGFYTFREAPIGEYGICTVCYWEGDPFQRADPTYAEGANGLSLNQAQESFRNSGSADPNCLAYARTPNREEMPD